MADLLYTQEGFRALQGFLVATCKSFGGGHIRVFRVSLCSIEPHRSHQKDR